jgi:hypothetical protein
MVAWDGNPFQQPSLERPPPEVVRSATRRSRLSDISSR